MGSKDKEIKIEDESENIDRRRSRRIVALEEKKQLEKERKLAIALERKKNQEAKNKGKEKATFEEWDDLSDFNDESPSKKGRKSKEFYQLISSIKSIQELGRQSQNASTSTTNESSLNGMPLKNILEITIDFLQRRDLDELFAEPVNPNVVGDYYEIVKQPMDFATMRAKLYEGMYTDIEQFKRDIFLICSNAVNVYPEGSKYHAVAEDISKHAKWTFEILSVDPQHLDLDLSHKKRPTKKTQKGQQRIPKRVAPKNGGRKISTETLNRNSYRPPNKPFFSEVLDANSKSSIQLNENTSIKYKESLMRFVKGLGPVAEKVAAKRLAALQDQQLCISENVSRTQSMHQPTPKALTHPVSLDATQSMHQPTPKALTHPISLNAQTLPISFPSLNRPLTSSGSATRENRTINTNNVGSVDMGDRPHQRNKTITGENWHAYAATLLSNFFFENHQGESSSANETMDARTLLKGKMVASVENTSSLLGPVQEIYKRQQLGVNNNNSSNHNTRQWSTSTNMPNMFSTGSSNNLFAPRSSRNLTPIVHPTRVVSGPQPRPMRSTSINSGSIISGRQPGIENTMALPSNNIPLFQPTQERSTSCMPSHNLTQPSLVRQPRPNDIVNNLTQPSLVRQSRPDDIVNNLTQPSLVRQPRPDDIVNNLTQPSLVRQPRPDDIVNLADLRLKPQTQLRDLMYQMPRNNLTMVSPMQKHHQPWPTNSMPNLNPSMLPPLCQPMQGESIPCKNLSARSNVFPSLNANFSNVSIQPMSFQAMMESQNFINDTWPMQKSFDQVMHEATTFTQPVTQGFPDMQMQTLNQLNSHVPPVLLQQPNSSSYLQVNSGGEINFCGGGSALMGQPEEPPPQLSWYGDFVPNLDLEL